MQTLFLSWIIAITSLVASLLLQAPLSSISTQQLELLVYIESDQVTRLPKLSTAFSYLSEKKPTILHNPRYLTSRYLCNIVSYKILLRSVYCTGFGLFSILWTHYTRYLNLLFCLPVMFSPTIHMAHYLTCIRFLKYYLIRQLSGLSRSFR